MYARNVSMHLKANAAGRAYEVSNSTFHKIASSN